MTSSKSDCKHRYVTWEKQSPAQYAACCVDCGHYTGQKSLFNAGGKVWDRWLGKVRDAAKPE